MVDASETIRYGMEMARLSRDDWVDSAYARFGEGGLDAVAVEPLARLLGTTKGSFYWHFADRAALVDAVLERWEALETDAVIAEVDAVADPRGRLDALVWVIAHRTPERGGESTLYTAAGRNAAADTVARVTERRVAYISSVLGALGLEPSESRRRAITLVAAVVGYQQLVATGWDPAQDPEQVAASLVEMALGAHTV